MITNVFIGLGTVLAGAALLVDTAAAYRTTMVAVGLLRGARDACRWPGCGRGSTASRPRMDAHLVPDRVPRPVAAARPHLRHRRSR